MVRNQALHVQHSFSLGSDTASSRSRSLVNTSYYKYLAVTFCSSSIPLEYIDPGGEAQHGKKAHMLDCDGDIAAWRVGGKHVRLQLPLFTSILTTSAMYTDELWSVHPRSAAQRRMTAQKHSKFLRQLIRV